MSPPKNSSDDTESPTYRDKVVNDALIMHWITFSAMPSTHFNFFYISDATVPMSWQTLTGKPYYRKETARCRIKSSFRGRLSKIHVFRNRRRKWPFRVIQCHHGGLTGPCISSSYKFPIGLAYNMCPKLWKLVGRRRNYCNNKKTYFLALPVCGSRSRRHN